jgi:ribose transport system permease protein
MIRQANAKAFRNQGLGKLLLDLLRRFSVVVIFLGLVLIFGAISGDFLTPSNLLNVARQTSIVAIVSVGMTFTILTAGIDLSVGSLVAVTGALAAMASARWGMPVPVAILVGMASGAVAGGISGLLVAKGGLPPFVATLAMMAAARGATLVITDARPITGVTKAFRDFGNGFLLGVPIPVWVLIMVAVLAWWVLAYTRFGRYVYALGGNEETAKLAGINVDRIKILVYVISGALSGLAGMILAARLNSAQPTAGIAMELDAIAAVVLGGTSLAGGAGGVGGSVIGALIMGTLANGLNLAEVPSYIQKLIQGAVIVLAVVLDVTTRRQKR